MKYGNHQNYCNGPGDCSCGEDSRQAGRSAITARIELSEEVRNQADEIQRLKERVKYWKHKAGISLKVGRREVVEWIKGANKSGDFYYSFDQAELEAQIKEWGL